MVRMKLFQVLIWLFALLVTSCKAQEFTSLKATSSRVEPADSISITLSPPASADGTLIVSSTRTPVPTVARTPGVLDCADIVKAHSESSLVEWEAIKMQLRGDEFYYTGTVFSVTEHDEVHLTGSLCHATLHSVPHEIAITLSHGQLIEGYGIITSIGFNRGEDVDVEVNPDLLFVH